MTDNTVTRAEVAQAMDSLRAELLTEIRRRTPTHLLATCDESEESEARWDQLMKCLEPGANPDFGDWPREVWEPILVMLLDLRGAARELQYQARVREAKKALEQIAASDGDGIG